MAMSSNSSNLRDYRRLSAVQALCIVFACAALVGLGLSLVPA
jgi:hypothetical protein